MAMRAVAFIILILTLPMTVHAQLFGVRGGLNISDQRYRIEGERITDESSPGIFFNIGISYEKVLSANQGIMGELFYSGEGASGTADQGIMRLHYLQLPILYYYQWPSGLRLYAGPSLSYLLNARANSHGFGTDRRDAYENYMLGITAGARYRIGQGWSAGARYTRGLSDFLNRDFYTFDLRSHTDTFQLYAAFTFQPL